MRNVKSDCCVKLWCTCLRGLQYHLQTRDFVRKGLARYRCQCKKIIIIATISVPPIDIDCHNSFHSMTWPQFLIRLTGSPPSFLVNNIHLIDILVGTTCWIKFTLKLFIQLRLLLLTNF